MSKIKEKTTYNTNIFLEKIFNTEGIEENTLQENEKIKTLLEFIYQNDTITPEILENISLEDIDKTIEVVDDYDPDNPIGLLAEMVQLENAKSNLDNISTVQTDNSADFF